MGEEEDIWSPPAGGVGAGTPPQDPIYHAPREGYNAPREAYIAPRPAFQVPSMCHDLSPKNGANQERSLFRPQVDHLSSTSTQPMSTQSTSFYNQSNQYQPNHQPPNHWSSQHHLQYQHQQHYQPQHYQPSHNQQLYHQRYSPRQSHNLSSSSGVYIIPK